MRFALNPSATSVLVIEVDDCVVLILREKFAALNTAKCNSRRRDFERVLGILPRCAQGRNLLNLNNEEL